MQRKEPQRIKLANTSFKHSEVAKKVIDLTSHLVPVDLNDAFVREQLIALDAAHAR